jgi:hypothetical protein
MSDWFFSKIRENYIYPLIIMFESGRFGKPTAILSVFDLVRAVQEYGVPAFQKQLLIAEAEAKAKAKAPQ